MHAWTYCDGFAQNIARQRLLKRPNTRVQRKSRSAVFPAWSAPRNSRSVFCVSVLRLYNGRLFIALTSERREYRNWWILIVKIRYQETLRENIVQV
jgi:hypothetical protein